MSEAYRALLFAPGHVVADDDPQLAFLRLFLPAPPGPPILDAGCGNGRFCAKLHELGYRDLVGADLYDRIETGGRFTYRQGRLEALPFPDASFGLVFSCSAIYHASDIGRAARELARVTRPGGVVLVTSHTRYSHFTLARVLRRARGSPAVAHLAGVRFPSAARIARAFRDAGLAIVLVDGFSPRSRWAARVTRVLGRGGRPPRVPTPWAWRRLYSELAYHSVVAGRRGAP